MRGVTFSSARCTAPQVVGTCTDGETTKTPQSLSEVVSFEVFGIVEALECSRMSGDSLDGVATGELDAVREYGAASEFLTGAASGNPSLSDAETIGAAADPVAALACLEQHIAGNLFGRLAFIHAAPQIATHLLAEAAVWRDGNLWRTASGNIVVVSSGYDGRSPADTDAPTAGAPMFLYATGEVFAAVGAREVLPALDRSNNTLSSVAEDAAIVVFDPCFNVAIDSGLNACVGVVS